MLGRFKGDAGKRLRLEAFLAQKLVAGNRMLADELGISILDMALAF